MLSSEGDTKMSNLESKLLDSNPEDHRILRLMDAVGAEQIASDPASRLKYVHGLNTDKFVDLLGRVNGIIKDVPIHKRIVGSASYIVSESAVIGSQVESLPPPSRDRRPLLDEAFEASKQMDNLDEIATMFGLAINAIHPFNDGNGRTSRFVYTFLKHGYDGSDKDKKIFEKILENTTGRKIVDINPDNSGVEEFYIERAYRALEMRYAGKGKLPRRLIDLYDTEYWEDQSPENINLGPNVSQESRINAHKVLRDKMGPVALMTLLISKGVNFERSIIKTRGSADLNTLPTSLLDMKGLLLDFTDQDISSLVQLQGKMKTNYVKFLISSFSSGRRDMVDSLVHKFESDFSIAA